MESSAKSSTVPRYNPASFSKLHVAADMTALVTYTSSVHFTADDLKDMVKRISRLPCSNSTSRALIQLAVDNYRDVKPIMQVLKLAFLEFCMEQQ